MDKEVVEGADADEAERAQYDLVGSDYDEEGRRPRPGRGSGARGEIERGRDGSLLHNDRSHSHSLLPITTTTTTHNNNTNDTHATPEDEDYEVDLEEESDGRSCGGRWAWRVARSPFD